MDLLNILKVRIEALAAGEHLAGLHAVLQHVQAAARHLERGQRSGDDTAFTDAIYRTNQAFEGSMKEAFRVLTGKDPSDIRPYDIENHLQTQTILRPRVLAQLATYRREWRNPSTHDYRLDFNEDEALLAIVSVSAFAIVMVNQIAEKLGFDIARAVAASDPHPITQGGSLADRVVQALMSFVYSPPSAEDDLPLASELNGAIAGHLSVALPDVTVESQVPVSPGFADTVDLLVKQDAARVIIKVRRTALIITLTRASTIARLTQYMQSTGIADSIVVVPRRSAGKMMREDVPVAGGRVIFLRPTATLAA